MNCPSCNSPCGPDDRFCGYCGERLSPAGAGSVQSSPDAASSGRDDTAGLVAVAAPATEAADMCPVCGAAGAEVAVACVVCGCHEEGVESIAVAVEPVVPPGPLLGGAHAATPSSTICPVHGPLEASWTRCPQCLRDGRDGRLDLMPGGEPAPAGVRILSQPPAAMPASPRGERGSRPPSSVGLTFVIGRRPRLLAYLIETEGESVGRVHQLVDGGIEIGRDPRNTIVLDDGLVSGFHARIEREGDGTVVIEDLGSTNGTRVNGEPLTAARTLVENDAVQIGGTVAVLKLVQTQA